MSNLLQPFTSASVPPVCLFARRRFDETCRRSNLHEVPLPLPTQQELTIVDAATEVGGASAMRAFGTPAVPSRSYSLVTVAAATLFRCIRRAHAHSAVPSERTLAHTCAHAHACSSQPSRPCAHRRPSWHPIPHHPSPSLPKPAHRAVPRCIPGARARENVPEGARIVEFVTPRPDRI